MDRRSKINGGLLVAAIWIGIQLGAAHLAHGAYLDELCQSDADSPQAFKALVEEAEATGMPSASLNRLLVRGYADADSKKTLHRLLCAIVQAEEEGLPPGLLFKKLDEGLGKRASLPRILEVINLKIDDMHYVQMLLSDGEEPLMEDDNVERLAKILAAGVSRQDLKALFDPAFSSPIAMKVVAAEIMAYGRAAGFNSRLLDQIIASGLESQAFTSDWTFFVKVVFASRKHQILDQQVAAEAIKVLSQKKPLDDLIMVLGLNPKDVYGNSG